MRQTTHSVIMVPPVDFTFNEQTNSDNEFQNKPQMDLASLRQEVLAEFNEMVNILRDQHLEVILLNKSHSTPELPDAVFPNNWFSTEPSGKLHIYPMKTANRQAEIRPQELLSLLERNHYKIDSVNSVSAEEKALEGTGAIIFDQQTKTAYAAISERCDEQLFKQYCAENDFNPIAFNTASSKGYPFYHTNVMLSIGEGFAVLCSEAIIDPMQREQLLSSLTEAKKQIIDINLEQAEHSFCANILQLRNSKNDSLIVMSDKAYKGFTGPQRRQLEQFGRLIACPIDTIEQVGGGSARCMLAENFLPTSKVR